MFENIQIIENTLNDPQYRDLTVNQHIIRMMNIIDLNHMSLKWLFFETIFYSIYLSIQFIWNYTNWSLEKPIQIIQSINRISSSVQFQSIPWRYRYKIYGLFLKTLVIDLIRICVVGFIYFKLQQMLMW